MDDLRELQLTSLSSTHIIVCFTACDYFMALSLPIVDISPLTQASLFVDFLVHVLSCKKTAASGGGQWPQKRRNGGGGKQPQPPSANAATSAADMWPPLPLLTSSALTSSSRSLSSVSLGDDTLGGVGLGLSLIHI